MPDQLTAWIRTVWPGVIAWLAAQVLAYLGTKVGIEINSTMVTGGITVVLLAIIYGLGHWLELRPSPTAQRIGHWLVSLGMNLGTPTYPATSTTAQSPAPDSPAAHRLE